MSKHILPTQTHDSQSSPQKLSHWAHRPHKDQFLVTVSSSCYIIMFCLLMVRYLYLQNWRKKAKKEKSLLFYPLNYYFYFLKTCITLKCSAMILFLPQVYHISRNTWFKMETRMIKNVCAPAVVLGERIVIVGGKCERKIRRLDTNLASFMEEGSLIDRCCPIRQPF